MIAARLRLLLELDREVPAAGARSRGAGGFVQGAGCSAGRFLEDFVVALGPSGGEFTSLAFSSSQVTISLRLVYVLLGYYLIIFASVPFRYEPSIIVALFFFFEIERTKKSGRYAYSSNYPSR